jgi:hypothetical protein
LFRYEIQNGGYGRTQFNIGPYGKNVSKCFSKTTWNIETKLPRHDHLKVRYKVSENRNFVEDHASIIPAKFGSNWPSGLGEEA